MSNTSITPSASACWRDGDALAGFEIRIDKPRALLRLTFWGFWRNDLGQRFRDVMVLAIRDISPLPAWDALADLREYPAQNAFVQKCPSTEGVLDEALRRASKAERWDRGRQTCRRTTGTQRGCSGQRLATGTGEEGRSVMAARLPQTHEHSECGSRAVASTVGTRRAMYRPCWSSSQECQWKGSRRRKLAQSGHFHLRTGESSKSATTRRRLLLSPRLESGARSPRPLLLRVQAHSRGRVVRASN
jgi:hypothetical protein